MSKKKLDLDEYTNDAVTPVIEPVVEVLEEIKTPGNSFPNSAFSIAKVGAQYKLIEIGFNLETGDTSIIKELGSYPSRQEAQERFKISVILKDAF